MLSRASMSVIESFGFVWIILGVERDGDGDD